MKNKTIYALIAGIVIGGTVFYLWTHDDSTSWTDQYEHEHDSEEFHVHADFLVYIGDEKFDFTQDKYQSTAKSLQSDKVHLHDNKGNVIHLHAEGITLGDFFTSLGFNLTNQCLVTDTKEEYCTDNDNTLTLYVNGKVLENIANYQIIDNDQILLYYGTSTNPNLQSYLSEISDLSCMYTGTCPERGTPPPEECGLTCEI